VTSFRWTSATPLQAYTGGGSILTIAGAGFSSNGFVYEAKFAAGPFQTESICSVASSFVLKCPIPKWSFGEMGVSFNLLRNGTRIGKTGACKRAKTKSGQMSKDG